MKLISLEIGEKFRSLHSGFKVNFHTSNSNLKELDVFQPFCLVGLNGSGKSNVLEVLANIFYHMELCGNKFKPDDFKNFFNPSECIPNSFCIEYITYIKGATESNNQLFRVRIEKESHKTPTLSVISFPKFDENEAWAEIPCISTLEEPANSKIFLPDAIVSYSSGENQILSLPFIKTRFIRFDEYIQASYYEYPFKEPESSMIYIDSEMSQAVLLSNLVFQNEATLKPLKDELGIQGMRSFRMNLNLHLINTNKGEKSLLFALQESIDKLKKCATSWKEVEDNLIIDFWIDHSSKEAIIENFGDAFSFFRVFQILYELNHRVVGKEIKRDVYQSKGYYTDGKIPLASPDDSVFYFLDFYIQKKVNDFLEPINLLLRNFSDGEHQFLHTLGILLLAKDKRTLFLLDEPETHFNPGWRAKFIKVLNDSIKASGGNNMMKEILLSSHSPFIISDCRPNNVIVFEKDESTGSISAKTANELNIRTFGASIEEISDKIFKYDQSIGELSNFELEKIDFSKIKTEEDLMNAKKSIQHLGDSIEKDLVLARLNQLLTKIKSN